MQTILQKTADLSLATRHDFIQSNPGTPLRRPTTVAESEANGSNISVAKNLSP